jgi:hypothetical protein
MHPKKGAAKIQEEMEKVTVPHRQGGPYLKMGRRFNRDAVCQLRLLYKGGPCTSRAAGCRCVSDAKFNPSAKPGSRSASRISSVALPTDLLVSAMILFNAGRVMTIGKGQFPSSYSIAPLSSVYLLAKVASRIISRWVAILHGFLSRHG